MRGPCSTFLVPGLVAVLCCCLTLTFGQRQLYREDLPTTWPVTDFPNPFSNSTDQQRMCGRDAKSSVCDPNGIITKQQAFMIDRAIQDVYRNTTCRCYECIQNNKGYIIRVAIMPRMQRIYPNSGNSSYMRLRDAEMYSYILSTRWRMEGSCNESLLILFSKDDDILYTLTRQLTSSVLSDQQVRTVSLGVRSYFDNKNTIAEGIQEMIRQYRVILSRT